MNRQLSRSIVGIAIIGMGVLALLNALNITSFNYLFDTWWPLLVVLAGVLILTNHPRQFLWPMVIILFGVLLQLRELSIITFNVWSLVWPAIIITFGASILINRSASHKNVRKKDLDDTSALLGGNSIKNESKDYKGGSASAIMGGVEIDLREAVIKDEATLNVFAFWGGITLKVPEGWKVTSKITPVAGGVDIKTKPADKGAPILYLVGDVVMGGVEVKHF
jgi:predicted membrane protein